MELTACRYQRRRNQLNPRSLKEAGQSPRTRRPSNQRTEAGQTPRTSRPPNQRTARPVASGRATGRTVHYFHSTAQPQVSHWSGSGLKLWLVFGGWVGGGGRPVTTVKDGSLRTQAVNPKKGWKLQGQNPQRVRDSESETHHQPKESETPGQRLVSSQRFDGLQRSQSLQSQRLETNQGASRSSQSSQRLTGRATHLTQWAMLNDQSHGSSGGCRLKEACCAKGRFFNPQGCET